jgi:hypothetical protein
MKRVPDWIFFVLGGYLCGQGVMAAGLVILGDAHALIALMPAGLAPMMLLLGFQARRRDRRVNASA